MLDPKSQYLSHNLMVTCGISCAVAMLVLMFGINGFIRLLSSSIGPVLVGIAAMFVMGAILPDVRHGLIVKYNSLSLLWGFCVYAIGVLIGCATNVFFNMSNGTDWNSYFVKPLFWLLFIGTLPSFLVGLSYLFKRSDLTNH